MKSQTKRPTRRTQNLQSKAMKTFHATKVLERKGKAEKEAKEEPEKESEEAAAAEAEEAAAEAEAEADEEADRHF